MDRDLVKRLILPLCIAAAGAVVLHRALGWDGFWLNLATELAGIVVTVVYVDYVLKRSAREKEAVADRRVNAKVAQYVVLSFSACRLLFDHRTGCVPFLGTFSIDMDCLREGRFGFDREELAREVLSRIDSCTPDQTAYWASQLIGVADGAEHALDMFGTRLHPEVLAELIEVHERSRRMTLVIERLTKPEVHAMYGPSRRPSLCQALAADHLPELILALAALMQKLIIFGNVWPGGPLEWI